MPKQRSTLTPAQRSQCARIGGYATAAAHDPRTYTAPARAAFDKRFEDKVDPDRLLPQAERQRRARAAKQAHMARLALASARARASRRA